MLIDKRVDKLNKVRQQGLIPGVIYGKEIESTPIQVDYKSLMETYKNYGQSRTFKVELDKKTHEVYIKDIDFNKARDEEVIHFGLLKVTASDTITAEIPIQINGGEAIIKQGLVVQHVLTSIPVSYPATESMSIIELDISQLNVGDALYVKDITLPKNFTTTFEEEEMVVNVVYPTITDTEEDESVGDEAPEEAQEETVQE